MNIAGDEECLERIRSPGSRRAAIDDGSGEVQEDIGGDDVDASCLSVTELVFVARAVHQLWRAGYDSGTVEPLNDATNLPRSPSLS